jgi:hypothetical protein
LCAGSGERHGTHSGVTWAMSCESLSAKSA